jgi:hypothetical protein
METLFSLPSLSEQSPAWFDVSQAFFKPRLVPPIAGVFLWGGLSVALVLAHCAGAASSRDWFLPRNSWLEAAPARYLN